MLKILVVEDDQHLRLILSKNLRKHGYDVLEAENGKVGYELFEHTHVDLVITDIMMPFIDGISLVKQIRQISNDIPIIMLTALDSYYDKEKGFHSGTDDYLVKPVNLNELLLRVKALLRRYKIASENVLNHSCIFLDYQEKSCKVSDKVVVLTVKEFELLYKLLSSPDRIFTRDQLMNEIWGFDSESYERTVDTHIKRLREKIQTDCYEIVTVRGLGYKVILK